MAYRDLLLTLASDPEATPPAAIDMAVDFAAAVRARISAIACEVRIAVPGSFLSPALVDVGSIAATDEKRSRLQAEALLAAFQAAAEKRDVYEERILARCLTSELSGLLVDYARLRDLTIMPVEENGLSGPWNPEAVVFGSGRPVLLLPRASQKPFALDTATVAWDFSRPAARAVADALPLLAQAKRVHIVTVINEKRIDTKGSGPELAKHLARHGVEVILDTVDAAGRPIGEALQYSAQSHDSDLLVMGAFGHSRLREFVLGGATRSMMSRPPLPIFLSH
jgi:nucleotide-binding universal stress UspA family protein